jgi:hypothetical protein
VISLGHSMLHRGARVLRWALCIAVVLVGVRYCFEARGRSRADEYPDQWRTEISDVQGGAYTARSTVVHHGTILLRLYRTGDSTLLAERTYREHGVELLWTNDELIYDTADDSFLGGGIQLPPTRLDKLLAKLP